MHKEHTDPHPDKLEDRIGRKLAEGWKAALNGKWFDNNQQWTTATVNQSCHIDMMFPHAFQVLHLNGC
eukprot:scaffold137_cov398-Prasinococcus_capsulatus_cf.AAC.53